jgi:hypothetical protein
VRFEAIEFGHATGTGVLYVRLFNRESPKSSVSDYKQSAKFITTDIKAPPIIKPIDIKFMEQYLSGAMHSTSNSKFAQSLDRLCPKIARE